MFNEFRRCYPQGSLISELVEIHEGNYIVKILAQMEGITLMSCFGSGKTIEIAEDLARNRLFHCLNLTIISEEKFKVNLDIKSVSDDILTEISFKDDQSTEKTLFDLTKENKIDSPNMKGESADLQVSSETKSSKTKKSKKAKNVPQLLIENQEIVEEIKPVEISQLMTENKTVISEEIKSGETSLLITESETVISEEIKSGETSLLITESETVISEENIEKTIDFGQILSQSDQELKRLGWTADRGQKYLIETYGKKSRQLLKNEELLEFVQYLQSIPTPILELSLTTENEQLIPKNEPIIEEVKPVETEQLIMITETVIKEDQSGENSEIINNNETSENLDLKLEISPPYTSQLIDFSDIIAKINVETKRLGWSRDQVRDHTLAKYEKRSLQLLSDPELMEFLEYLENLPSQ